MARVTVEDCVEKFPTGSNWSCCRPSARARYCRVGPDRRADNDKNPVIACAKSPTRRSNLMNCAEALIRASSATWSSMSPEEEEGEEWSNCWNRQPCRRRRRRTEALSTRIAARSKELSACRRCSSKTCAGAEELD